VVGRAAASALKHQPARFAGGAGVRAFIAARSRYAEDRLAEAVRDGVRQYVILGAGLDTFAYRNRVLGLRTFEVDHPATQTWKHERLRDGGIRIPDSVRFVAVDFEAPSFTTALDEAGFDRAAAAFVSVLGVMIFLAEQAVRDILAFVESLSPGSGLTFDYGVPDAVLTPEQLETREMGRRQAAALGEPWITFMDPSVLAGELRARGLGEIDDLDPEELNRRYFTDRKDGLRVSGGGRRLICARRRGRGL